MHMLKKCTVQEAKSPVKILVLTYTLVGLRFNKNTLHRYSVFLLISDVSELLIGSIFNGWWNTNNISLCESLFIRNLKWLGHVPGQSSVGGGAWGWRLVSVVCLSAYGPLEPRVAASFFGGGELMVSMTCSVWDHLHGSCYLDVGSILSLLWWADPCSQFCWREVWSQEGWFCGRN